MTMQKIIESLTPNERKILPHLEEKKINDLCKKSNLDKVSVLRSLKYLEKKEIVKLTSTKNKIVDVGVNGALYQKKGLPERRLMNLLSTTKIIPLNEAQKESKLSNEEFKAALGALKKKALIELKNQKIILNANREEIAKKSLEEMFLDSLPIDYEKLAPEQQLALKALQSRKNIIQLHEDTKIEISITDFGRKIINLGTKTDKLIEKITPEILKKWKGKKFRRYDVTSYVPSIYGGKRHFVNQSKDYARKVWTQMGFKEMSGNMLVSSFWNFDALFTAQDHPVREMQDTFFINKKVELPNKKLVKTVRDSHERGIAGSKGWQYEWDEEDAKKMVIRTHTTCLSSQKLATLNLEDLPQKFFSVGKCFRNETVDWKHGFEFNQTEGIVVDPNANFRHLLGYMKQFAEKMGFKKIRFRPAYFPYTEPSLEGDVWNEEKKEWVELIAAGIFRPEVTAALLGKPIPILAWGPGFDRMIQQIFEIKDLREMYKNDLNQLRKMKTLMK